VGQPAERAAPWFVLLGHLEHAFPSDDHWLDAAPTFAACVGIHTVELRIRRNGMRVALSEIA
ncbi:MAG: hypothetical protein ABSE50_09920, partial [Xanthobacteraceae bacterium]